MGLDIFFFVVLSFYFFLFHRTNREYLAQSLQYTSLICSSTWQPTDHRLCSPAFALFFKNLVSSGYRSLLHLDIGRDLHHHQP